MRYVKKGRDGNLSKEWNKSKIPETNWTVMEQERNDIGMTMEHGTKTFHRFITYMQVLLSLIILKRNQISW